MGSCRKGYELNGSKAKGKGLRDWARLKLAKGGGERREQGRKEGMRDGKKREDSAFLTLIEWIQRTSSAMNKSPI